MKKKKVYLTLQNGAVFQGYAFGADGDISGELVFSTGMVGYIETLTDPSNYGQIIVQTFPLIGNYGMMKSDIESKRTWVSAYVVREICDQPSNFRLEGDLESYLKEEGVVGICGIDTRQITKILREEGTMNARISSHKLNDEEVNAIASYSLKDAVKAVSDNEKAFYQAENAKYTVALWNFGAKHSTIDDLLTRGCNVICMPAGSTAEEILETGAHGVMLSDGPGDPKENQSIINEIKKLVGKKPIFGVGLGHQMVALALGGDTQKAKYGHRGSNQPVRCNKCGKIFISTQNHGYDVIAETVKQGEIKFVNVNDGSCEGIDYDQLNAFTVQFTPESCDIGMPENPLYKKFFAMMEKENENA